MSYQFTVPVQAVQNVSGTLPTLMAGTFTLGSSGAVSASDGNSIAGYTVAKTASTTGRYDITTHRKFKKLVVLGCVVEGPASAAFGNTNANAIEVRNVDGTATVSANVQLFLASSGADTEGASGYKVHLTLLGYDH